MKRSLQSGWRVSRQAVQRAFRSSFFFLVSGLWILISPAAHAILDTNSNGMSDLWEKQFNNDQLFPNTAPCQLSADPDGDGWNNANEAEAGTNPFDPNPPGGGVTPSIVQEQAPGAFTLTWPSLPGKIYQLQASSALTQGTWIDIGLPRRGDGELMEELLQNETTNGSTPPKFFFRVAINDIDEDGDGLTNAEEHALGTNPEASDSDSDGLGDHAEMLAGLNPNNPDCDLDGILDGADFTPLSNNAIADPDGENLPSSLATSLTGRWDLETITNINGVRISPNTANSSIPAYLGGAIAADDSGMVSKATRMSAMNQYLKADPSIIAGKTSFSISLWFRFEKDYLQDKPGSLNTVMFAFNDVLDATPQFQLHAYKALSAQSTQKLIFSHYSNTILQPDLVGEIPLSAPLDDGNWQHLTLTKSSGTIRIYRNAQQIMTGGVHSGTWGNGANGYLCFGALAPAAMQDDTNFRGSMDRLRTWSRAITQSEITALHHQDIDRDGLWDITESETRYSDYQSTVIYHPDPADPTAPQPTQTGYARSPFLYSSGTLDFDQDELNDLAEQTTGTRLTKPDTDDDNLTDGFEVANLFNPLNAYSLGITGPRDDLGDPDSDSLLTLTEYFNGSNPRNSNSDGDATHDAAEVAQGSDPANAADSGATPTDSPEQVPFHIFGDYTAWEATIKGKGPNDTRTRRFRMSAHNVAANQTLDLLRGNSYELNLRYIRSKPGESVPWYCWETTIDGKSSPTFTVADHWIVDNNSALLAEHTHSHGTNQIAEKKVDIVPVEVNWKAIVGFDNLSDHTDPWMNPVYGKRIFPDYKDPNDTEIRHKLEVIVKTSSAHEGKAVFVKAYDVDDSTSEAFDVSPAVIDPNGKAGGDNLPDFLNTPLNGQFWTGSAWGNETAQGTVDANGETKFIFKVGMQPGNNYKIVASVIDESMYSGVQTADPATAKYLGPESNQNGGAPATSLLTVWRRLWVENDSMEAIQTDAFGYKRNDLSSDNQSPTIDSAFLNASSNTEFQIPMISDHSSFSDIDNGRIIIQSISHPVIDTSIWAPGTTDIHVVTVSGNHTSVPIGSEFRLYDDDDSGLDENPLPRNDLVNGQMKNYFKTSFVEVTDAAAFNPRKLVPFRRNQNVYSDSTVVDDAWDLTDKNVLWVCPVTVAYQSTYEEDHDPSGIDELMTFGDTVAHGDFDHSTVYVEGCREQYDIGLRSSNSVNVALDRDRLKRFIVAAAAHEMGHQPADQSAQEDHSEEKLMSEGLRMVNETSPESSIFTTKTVYRFRKSTCWSK
jgi:hypothetical protein